MRAPVRACVGLKVWEKRVVWSWDGVVRDVSGEGGGGGGLRWGGERG